MLGGVRKYMVSFGGEKMKGGLRDNVGRIQRQLPQNYNGCRAGGTSATPFISLFLMPPSLQPPHPDIAVSNRTYPNATVLTRQQARSMTRPCVRYRTVEAKTEFKIQAPSISDILQHTSMSLTKSGSIPEQPEKNKAAAVRGGAQSRQTYPRYRTFLLRSQPGPGPGVA